MLGSIVCKYADFGETWYKNQELNLLIRQIYPWHSAAEVDFVNRKFWEWCAISQALDERCKLRTGLRGLGFAVGTEPLASHFAGRGCTILATDLHTDTSDAKWIATGEHAKSREALFYGQLVNRDLFDARVAFLPADMRSLGGMSGGYDFVWSSCALEHLGTLQAGVDFVIESANLLKQGGVAVHTTEFNVLSDDKTVEVGGNVIYRRRDILDLAQKVERHGLNLVAPNFDAGDHPFDIAYDTPPYMQPGSRHIRLEIDGFISTSMLLIVEKA